MKIVLQHPTGNSFVRATSIGLLKANLLEEFHTCFASFPGTFLDIISSIGVFSEISRRRFYPGLKPITYTNPWLEIGRLIALKAGFSILTKHEMGIFSIDAVYKNLDKVVAKRLKYLSKKGVKGIYAYEDGAIHSFTEAKKYGISCFYDLPIGYWRAARKLLEAERQRWPEWSSTLTGLADSNIKLACKDEELQKADLIFVASTFTANTLKDFPGPLAQVKIIPYGFPAVATNRCYDQIKKRAIKLLFVGGLSQRKGIADIFAAVNKIGVHVQLTVVGHKVSNCLALNIELSKHRWIPTLNHDGILKLMREHDVLILPSLFEGFGLVISEAMSQGTPVITTERTAGPDLIEHGKDGWLIKAGSTETLQAAIENLLCNPDLIEKAGRAAMDTARKRPWEVYGKELAESLIKLSI